MVALQLVPVVMVLTFSAVFEFLDCKMTLCSWFWNFFALFSISQSGNGENRCCRGLRQLRACLVRRVPFSNWKIFKLLVSYFEAVLRAFLFSSERGFCEMG